MAKLASRNITKGPAVKTVKDGALYTAVDADGVQVYKGSGQPLDETVRVALGLVAPTGVARVEADGTLTPGSILRDDSDRVSFRPVSTPAVEMSDEVAVAA